MHHLSWSLRNEDPSAATPEIYTTPRIYTTPWICEAKPLSYPLSSTGSPW